MANNNLADISVLENLQSRANNSFGSNQMAAFQTDVAVNNVDMRELIALLATIDTLEDKNAEYTKAIAQKDTTGAETIKTSAKTLFDKASKKLIEFENEIKQDQKQIQSAKNRLETAKRTLKL
jgi:chromosome segregation ATPase